MLGKIFEKKLFLVCGLAFLLRLLVPVISILAYHDSGVFYSDDTESYIKPAGEMLERGSFTVKGAPELFRTPGYSIFLFPGIILGAPEFVSIALQILLGTLTVYLLDKLALLVFGNPAIALAAAFLYALEPLAIIFCGLLLSETLFTFVIVAFLYCFVLCLKTRSWLFCSIAVLLLCAATYIRPVSLYFNIAASMVIIFHSIIKRDKKTVIQMAAFLVASFALNGLWILRNGAVAGYSGFSSVTDVNLYSYQAAAVMAKKENKPYYDTMAIMNRKADRYRIEHNLTEAQTLAYMRSEGSKIIFGHPLDYGLIHVKGMAAVMFTPGAIEILKMLKAYPHRGGLIGRIVSEGFFSVLGDLVVNNPLLFWTQAVLFIQLIFYYFLLVCHFFSKNKTAFPFLLLFGVFLFYFIFTSGGPHAVDRFRHPVMPVVCLFAGSGWMFVKNKLLKKPVKNASGEKPDGTPEKYQPS